jgi:hypothetical protein
MKTYIKLTSYIAGIVIISSFVLVPAFTFAKENNGKGNNKNEEKKEQRKEKNDRDDDKNDNKGDKKCLRAFGHLIAPGWFKKNGKTFSDDCNLPFGIGHHHNGQGTSTPATTTPDTTAPVISNLTSSPRVGSVVVRWTTNERSNTVVFFGLSSPVSATGTAPIMKSALVRDHEVTIPNLTASTTYYAVVRSTDASGNVTLSPEFSFTTKSPIAANDTAAPVISSIVSVTGTSNVQVGWTTNEFATSRVYYSASSTVDINATSTAFVDKGGSLDKAHLVNVTGLTASSTYYFIVESADASGNISRSAAFSATTGTLAPVVDVTAPIISNAVAVVGTTTLQLSWNTNENATTRAYYSTTSPVDVTASSTPFIENVSLVSSHTLTVPSLATSTSYFMILESRDSSGNTARTAQFSFTTGI